MGRDSVSIEIDRDPKTVFQAISDVTRMGEWSPECTAGRWVGGASAPAVGAEFEGDNRVALLGVTLKRWTTTSEVTACVPGALFEFVAAGYTTWRYQFESSGSGTRVTESYECEDPKGVQGFVYEKIVRRPATLKRDMRRTLERMKDAIEAS